MQILDGMAWKARRTGCDGLVVGGHPLCSKRHLLVKYKVREVLTTEVLVPLIPPLGGLGQLSVHTEGFSCTGMIDYAIVRHKNIPHYL